MSKPTMWAITIMIGGGFGLALAGLFLPYDIAPVLAITLGAFAVAKVFWTPGQISYKRDLALWGIIILMLGFTRVSLMSLCLRVLLANERCQPAFIQAILFISTVYAIGSLLFFWSWLRLQSLRQHFSKPK